MTGRRGAGEISVECEFPFCGAVVAHPLAPDTKDAVAFIVVAAQARQRGWSIEDDVHLCPAHRDLPPMPPSRTAAEIRADWRRDADDGVGIARTHASDVRTVLDAFDEIEKAAHAYLAAQAARNAVERAGDSEDAIAEADAELHVARVALYAALPRTLDATRTSSKETNERPRHD